MPSVQPWYDWVCLRDDLELFRKSASLLKDPAKYKAHVQKLRSALTTHGLSHLTEVTIYDDLWNRSIDLLDETLVTVCSSNLKGPRPLASLTSLRSLTQDISKVGLVTELYGFVQINPRLQELNISILGRDMLSQVEPIVQLCRYRPRPFAITLFDRTKDKCGRVVAQFAFGGSGNNPTKSTTVGLYDVEQNTLSIQGQVQDIPVDLRCLQWDFDNIHFHFSDFSASLLDSATKHHPSILISLSCDISALSKSGLACIERVLARSPLDYLCVLCTSFESIMSKFITHFLRHVPWHTLKYLVLSGENIDGWLRIWDMAEAPRLLRLDINGSGSVLRELSHAGVLVLHRMIYESPLAEFHLGNVYLQDKGDWGLIVDSLDPQLLETFSLCSSIANQFLSRTDIVDLFIAKFQTQEQGGVNVTIALGAFNLDIVPLFQDDRVRLLNILSRSTLKHLRVNCASFDHSFIQLLDFMPWSTVTTLVLTGDYIDAWIQLLDVSITRQLRHLSIQGTESDTRRLSHASSLVVQGLILACPLVELKFESIQLQDPTDWTAIIESTDSSKLKDIGMCEYTKDQLMTVRQAIHLYNIKFKRNRDEYLRYLPSPSDDETLDADFLHRAMGAFKKLGRKWVAKLLYQDSQ